MSANFLERHQETGEVGIAVEWRRILESPILPMLPTKLDESGRLHSPFQM